MSALRTPTAKVALLFIPAIFAFAYLYSTFEGVPYFDALYWTITTCSTVGYGDISPATVEGRVLTIFVMISGVALLGFILTAISNSIVSMNLGKLMGLRGLRKRNHTIIVGWNLVAKNALEELVALRRDVVIIDHESRMEVSTYPKTQFVLGDFHSKDTLRKAGIIRAQSIILATESDSEVILVINLIRSLNPHVIIVGRIDDGDFETIAKRAGCNRVVSPSGIGGNLLASTLHEPAVVRWFMEATASDHGIGFDEIRISDRPELVGRRIGRVVLPNGHRIVGIDQDSDEVIEALPDEHMFLKEDDTLILVVKTQQFESTAVTTRSKATDGDKNNKRYLLVCGWNPTVKSMVNELLGAGREGILVMDEEPPPFERRHYEALGVTFLDSEISKLSLKSALERELYGVVLGMEEDADVILLAHVVKALKPDINLIARVDETDNMGAAFDAGVDNLVSPSEIGGRLLVHAIDMPSAVRWIMEATTAEVGAKVKEIHVANEPEMVGVAVGSLELGPGLEVVGVEKEGGLRFETLPTPDYMLREEDILVVVAK